MSPTTIMATGAAVADATRLLILFVLGAGPLPVGQLATRVHVTSPSVSYHLGRLRAAGLVFEERLGRRTLVRRNEPRWAAIIGAFAKAE